MRETSRKGRKGIERKTQKQQKKIQNVAPSMTQADGSSKRNKMKKQTPEPQNSGLHGKTHAYTFLDYIDNHVVKGLQCSAELEAGFFGTTV